MSLSLHQSSPPVAFYRVDRRMAIRRTWGSTAKNYSIANRFLDESHARKEDRIIIFKNSSKPISCSFYSVDATLGKKQSIFFYCERRRNGCEPFRLIIRTLYTVTRDTVQEKANELSLPEIKPLGYCTST